MFHILLSKDVEFKMMAERVEAWKKIKDTVTTETALFHPDFTNPSKLYVDSSFEGLGAALHQVQIGDGKPLEVPVVFISTTKG